MAYSVASVKLEKGVIYGTTDTDKEFKIDFNSGTMYGVSGKPVGNLPAFKKYFMESFIPSENSLLFFRVLYCRRYDANFASNYRLMRIIDRLVNMGYDYDRIHSIIDYYSGWKGNGDLNLDSTYKEIAKILKNAPQSMTYRDAISNYKKNEFYEILNKCSHSELLTEQDRNFLYRQIFNNWSDHQSLIKKHLSYFVYWTVFCELKYYWSMLVSNRYGRNENAFGTPFDYLQICEKMNIEPDKKNLYKHMATTYKAWQIWKDAKLNERIAEKQTASKAKLFFEDENFTMVFPMTAAEFVAEGEALNNCLGWNHYADKVAEGDHIVCFVRYKDNPNKSYVACDICFSQYKGYEIIQFLGVNNRTPNDTNALEYKKKLANFLESLPE